VDFDAFALSESYIGHIDPCGIREMWADHFVATSSLDRLAEANVVICVPTPLTATLATRTESVSPDVFKRHPVEEATTKFSLCSG